MTTNDLPEIKDLKITIEAEGQTPFGETQTRTVEIKKDKDNHFKVFAKVGEEISDDERFNILETAKSAVSKAQFGPSGQVTLTQVKINPGEKRVVEIDFSDPHFQGLVIVIPRDETISLTRVTYSRFTLKESMLTHTDKEIRLFFSVNDSLQAEKSPQGVMLDFNVRSKEMPEYSIAKTSTVQIVAKSATGTTRELNAEQMALTDWTLGLS